VSFHVCLPGSALDTPQRAKPDLTKQQDATKGTQVMPLDLGTLEYLHEQMSLVEPITIKRMSGGAGVYARGYFFALIDDDTVYFKTDDSNRGDYLTMKSPPFAPYGEEHGSMDYYELPDVILDNPAKLKVWMEKSIDVAMRAKNRKGGVRTAKRVSNKPLGESSR
jgi:DNA transformation protein